MANPTGITKYGSTAPNTNDDGITNDNPNNRFPTSIEEMATVDTATLGEQAHLLVKEEGCEDEAISYGPEQAPWYSKLIFGWMAPLLAKGNSKPQLDPSDLKEWPLPSACQTSNVVDAFQHEWETALRKDMEEEEHKENDDGVDGGHDHDYHHHHKTLKDSNVSLAWCLARAFGGEFAKAGCLKLCHDILIFVGPQVLNGMIQFLRQPNAPMWHGFLLTFTVTCSQLGMSLCLRHYFFKCYLTGLKIRTSIIAAIYKKSLDLASYERQSRSSGEITNLMSVDAQRLQDLVTYLHAIWYSFLQIGLAIYFLWQQLGVSCLGGVAVIVAMIPVTKRVAQWMGSKQKKLMKVKDERVNINNEVLGSMKVIKFQAWEPSFQSKIMNMRQQELRVLFNYFLASATSGVLWGAVPLLVAVATFAAYVLSGHTLDVAEALTALALFEILRFPLFMLPNVINNIVEAMISLGRVRSFLLCDEHEPLPKGSEPGIHIRNNASFVYESKRPDVSSSSSDVDTSSKKSSKKKPSLYRNDPKLKQSYDDARWEISLLQSQLKDAERQIKELQWGNDSKKESTCTSLEECCQPSGGDTLLSLRRVNLDIGSNDQERGELIAVVGAVGSGKSTLINAVLGEIRPLGEGVVEVSGDISYFSQTPFILNDTVRGNILFGSTSNDGPNKMPVGNDYTRYQQSLKVCALTRDLQMLPGGDLCEIGEKGITLSGGQKARISMARAVYHNSDIYLLDDPLAAVDAHVGRHLFHKCILQNLMGYYGDEDDKKKKKTNNGTGTTTSRKKTVVLVTNALQYLSHPRIDKILVLNEGCIQERGTYKELTSNPHSLFSTFLKSFNDSLGDKDAPNQQEAPTPSTNVEGTMTPNDSANSLNMMEDGSEQPDLAKVLAPLSPVGRKQSVSSSRRMTSVGTQSFDDIDLDASGKSKKSVNNDDSSKNDNDNNDEEGQQQQHGQLTTDEFAERDIGHVSLKVYASWARAAGGLWVAFLILLATANVEGINILSKWWLTYWSTHGEEHGSSTSSEDNKDTVTDDSSSSSHQGQMFYLTIYGLINLGAVLATFLRMLMITLGGLSASRKLFSNVLDAVLKAPMAFFDTTPIGRIVNRFSKDMYTVDEQLVATIRSYLGTMGSVCSTIVVVSSITPWFMICLIPIIGYYMMQSKFFTKSYRELRRLDSVSRSPMYALLGETLDGISTIRAYGAQQSLMTRLTNILELQQTAYFLTFTAQCWLAVRLELVGTVIITLACLFAVLEHPIMAGNEQFAGLAGLSISYALSVTQSLNWSVRMSSDLEANMIAVERIEQYIQLPSEAARDVPRDDELRTISWPTQGEIIFKDVKMRYRPNLPLVLKGLALTIPAHAKVGIVGRTGAGKSTLMVALLRMVELDSGKIEIDGVNIQTVGLTLLRSKMAVIPQDPCLFTGSIRSNLDPFDEYTDTRLYEVLQRVGLYEPAAITTGPVRKTTSRMSSRGSSHSLGGGGDNNKNNKTSAIEFLTDKVLEGGSNFSVGQRQLLVIARALLRQTSIVIMDEATAAVDAETDSRIQKVMRTEFSNATTLTVAHRLNTIMDSTHILVMDAGRAAEFDSPTKLLQRGGLFKDLVDTWEQEHGTSS